MTRTADLSGKKILVVEDEYYLATDIARALTAAGAKVLGPCPDAESALDVLSDEAPSGVLLDINLGDGADFRVAAALAKRQIPFIFATGYDPEVIPAEFSSIKCLHKPLRLNDIVQALGGGLPA